MKHCNFHKSSSKLTDKKCLLLRLKMVLPTAYTTSCFVHNNNKPNTNDGLVGVLTISPYQS